MADLWEGTGGKVSLNQARQIVDFVRSVRDLRGQVTEREQLAVQEMRRLQAEDRQWQQYQVNKWIDAYNETGSVARKRELTELLKMQLNTMDPRARSAMAPYLQMSPVDPAQERLLQFDKLNPPPERPTSTFEEDPMSYFEYAFARERRNWQRERFMGLDPGPPIEVMTLGTGTESITAIQKKGTRGIKIVTGVQERMDEIGKGLPGEPTGAGIIANGYKWRTGEPRELKIGGKIMLVTPMKNHLTGEQSLEKQVIGEAAAPVSPPKELVEFASYHAAGEGDTESRLGRLYNRYVDMVKGEVGGEQALNAIIKSIDPRWNAAFVGPADRVDIDLFFNDYVRGENNTLAFFPGELTTLPAGKVSGNVVYIYFDQVSGTAYAPNGRFLGSLEEARAIAAESEGQKPRR